MCPSLSNREKKSEVQKEKTMFKYIIYISQPTMIFDDGEMVNLLLKTRENNRLRNVTGLLIHRPGYFMEYVEGDPQAVDSLVTLIQQDRRHTDLLILDTGMLEERHFTEWSMGFYQGSFWKSGNIQELNKQILPDNWPEDYALHAPLRLLKNFADSISDTSSIN